MQPQFGPSRFISKLTDPTEPSTFLCPALAICELIVFMVNEDCETAKPLAKDVVSEDCSECQLYNGGNSLCIAAKKR